MSVTVSGPLFSANVGRVVDRALGRMVADVAQDALEAVKAELRPGHGVDSGDFEDSLRVQRKGAEATVYSPQAAKAAWLEGTSRRNRTTSFKGFGIFTKATKVADRRAGRVADKRGAEIARDLS